MKKLLTILFVVGLFACNDKDTVTITKDQLKALTKDSTDWELKFGDESYPIAKGSDGHDYYFIYIATGAYTGGNRPFHLPSCRLCKKYDKVPSYKN